MNLVNCGEKNASVRDFLVENTLTICMLMHANNDEEEKIYLKI
jgi:hypothetical protein